MITPTTFLRPVHGWFFAWERAIPSVYRVVAVVIAAGASAAVLATAGLGTVVAVVISLAVWVGLAVAQEHDERVRLPVLPQFAAALEHELGKAPPLLVVDHASGPSRARPSHDVDRFLLTSEPGEDHALDHQTVEVQRDRSDGSISAYVSRGPVVESLDARLRSLKSIELADRLLRPVDPGSDAEAIATALRVVSRA